MPYKQKIQTHPEAKPGSERADIARRVANFKAHQTKLQHEREQYYQSVRARIVIALDELPATDAGSTVK